MNVSELPEGFNFHWGYWEKGNNAVVVKDGQIMYRAGEESSELEPINSPDLARQVSLTLAGELDPEHGEFGRKIEKLKKELLEAEKEAQKVTAVIADLKKQFDLKE